MVLLVTRDAFIAEIVVTVNESCLFPFPNKIFSPNVVSVSPLRPAIMNTNFRGLKKTPQRSLVGLFAKIKAKTR